MADLQALGQEIVQCCHCPRLVQWRQQVAEKKVARYRHQTYWGKPIPGFGDPQARLLIVGLAPAAHGGNRTGRVFTGDASGDWLFRALYRAGFANQPTSVDREDGLEVKDCYISAVVRCAPPDNKPTSTEAEQCRVFLQREMQALPHLTGIVTLGKFAFDHTLKVLFPQRWTADLKAQWGSKPLFSHNRLYPLPEGRFLMCSYHPSQRNTSTKLLTEVMLDQIFVRVRELLDSYSDQL